MSKTKLALTIMGISILLISVITGTYAYFTASVNDDTSENASLTSGNLSLALNDMDVTSLTSWVITPSDLSRTIYLSVTNNSPIAVDAKLLFKGLTNTYSRFLVYTLEEVSSNKAELNPRNILIDKWRVPESTSASNKKMASINGIPANTTKYYKVIIEYIYSDTVNQTNDLNKRFYTGFALEENKDLADKTFMALNLTLGSNTPDFNNTSPGDGTVGVYETEDDYGISYYFRGNVTNNYVKFGKNSSNQDMWWRIVRINGDGSLRLIYDGTQAYANGTNNYDRLCAINVSFNTTCNDAKYVGYMYGGAEGEASTSYVQATTNETDSTIKKYLDGWYVTNIKNTGYENYLGDEIFCNDRSIISGNGYGQFGTNYRANYGKMTLICPQKNDAFTVSDTTKGNGTLTNPIGLLTADEAKYAGGKSYTVNTSYYLYRGTPYWLLSPYLFYTSVMCARPFSIISNGTVRDEDAYSTRGVVPVINLSVSTAKSLVGNGTAETPYRLP